MIIYLRHGEDGPEVTSVSSNKKTSRGLRNKSKKLIPHHHDLSLTAKGANAALTLARQLVKRYGPPQQIYYSPFRRTRQTLTAMEAAWAGYPQPRLRLDITLARHFSRREQTAPSMAESTYLTDPPIYEPFDQFRKRARRRAKRLKKHSIDKADTVVWCITHVLVFKRAAKIFSVDIPSYIPFLGHFIVDRDGGQYLEHRERQSK